MQLITKVIQLFIGLQVCFRLHPTHKKLFTFSLFAILHSAFLTPLANGHFFIFGISVCGEVDALRALLAAGADITKTDLNGGSPVSRKYT